jgi:hypothetical protein
MNRYVGNLPPMPGVFPDYPAPVIRNMKTGASVAARRRVDAGRIVERLVYWCVP